MSEITLRSLEGKYEILGQLREGGMGAIYKVRHRLLDEIRVVKVMRPQLVESEELKARFLREARFAIKLRHTNIAEIYDFTVDESDGTAYIVLEFIDGRTFEDLIAQSELPPLRLTLELAQQALRALGYLHAKGFIHRDISPDNLMVTVDSEGQPLVKLIDLGIARALGGAGDGLTQTGTFLGKIRYAPPEQFRPEGSKADARGDLYSFGIVLYELLTGRYPILGKDLSSLIAGHLFHAPLDFAESDPGRRVPPRLRETVLKSIAKKAEERFASAHEFSQALAAFRAGRKRRTEKRQPPLKEENPEAEDFDKPFERLTDLRRASEVQAAVSRIEASLEQRDLGAASELLDRAVARLGAEPALRAAWERLEGLRRAEHEHRTDNRPSVT